MSLVTNCILTYGCGDLSSTFVRQAVMELFYKKYENEQTFEDVEDYAGGHKLLECTVMVAAFNYCQLEDLIKLLKSLSWAYPEEVQLFVKEQEDLIFTERLHMKG